MRGEDFFCYGRQVFPSHRSQTFPLTSHTCLTRHSEAHIISLNIDDISYHVM